MAVYAMCLCLFALGLYCVMAKRNIIKIVVGLVVCETAVNLFFVLVAYKGLGHAPIFDPVAEVAPGGMVDPLPHVLVLTAIVIGLATTALLVVIAMRLYEKYGTYDIAEIRELRG